MAVRSQEGNVRLLQFRHPGGLPSTGAYRMEYRVLQSDGREIAVRDFPVGRSEWVYGIKVKHGIVPNCDSVELTLFSTQTGLETRRLLYQLSDDELIEVTGRPD